MKPLFTPWRMDYIKGNSITQECIFCLALNQTDDANNLIVQRGSLAFVILNRFPYASGHLMVVPYAHVPTFEILDTATRSEIMELLSRSVHVLDQIYQPNGYNVGANIGSAAGAGVAGHVHFHVVPRWSGDTNFMTIVGETRVIPEDLGVTYRKVCEQWGK